MPESPVTKLARSVSPAARAGAGDISERELSRERSTLTCTPPARLHRSHPKKQLFLTPVSKFTAGRSPRGARLACIRGCLAELTAPRVDTQRAVPHKAASMEDLTPTKRVKRDIIEPVKTSEKRSRTLEGVEAEAAAKVARFMVVAAWRRRRDELRCVRKTLEFQVSCSERLRLQVRALKALLDSDNSKVRLAMRELDRLKQLLREREQEKAVLERENRALEDDVCAAEDRASEMSIGWRNARNEAECARAAAAHAERSLALERAAHLDTRADRDRAFTRLTALEEDLCEQEAQVSAAEARVAALTAALGHKQRDLDALLQQLAHERQARDAVTRECAALGAQLSHAATECEAARRARDQLQSEAIDLRARLRHVTTQLEWWPAPLTRMVGSVRAWLRRPLSAPAVLLSAAVPPPHGCHYLLTAH